jgi:hypothetical protein
MASTVNASATGLQSTADTSGVLTLQTNGTNAMSISTSQVVSFVNPPTTSTGATYATTGKAIAMALVFGF